MRAAPWLLIATLGLAGCVVALIVDADTFAYAWLAATLTWGLLPIGALAVLMTAGLAGGGWSEVSRSAWRGLAACLPLLVLALLPLLLFAREALFPWTHPVEQLPEVVQRKLLYLNVPFFTARTVGYLVIWLLLAYCMGVWHSARRAGGRLCAGGLVALLYTLSFFGFDWFLSLQPKFYTDVFGLWMADTVVAGAGALVLLKLGSVDDEAVVMPRADLANLWLCLLLGWLFLAFSQYIVVWQGNIPHEIEWFLQRDDLVWTIMMVLAGGCLFALPFLALLFRWVKERGRALQWVAAVVLVGYVLQMQWWVLPASDSGAWRLYWMAPVALATLGSLLVVCWIACLRVEEAADGQDH